MIKWIFHLLCGINHASHVLNNPMNLVLIGN